VVDDFHYKSGDQQVVLETISVTKEGSVLFAEILAPPMNLLGPELVRDLVSLIQGAEADETIQVLVFKSADRDYFIAHVDVTRISEYREAAGSPVDWRTVSRIVISLSECNPARDDRTN